MTKAVYVNAPRATVAMGAAGALVGGAVAAARNYDKVQKKEITREAAVKDVIRETGTTGLATATATALVGAMGFTGLLSLAGMVLVTAGAKHMADRVIDGRKTRTALPASPTPPDEGGTGEKGEAGEAGAAASEKKASAKSKTSK